MPNGYEHRKYGPHEYPGDNDHTSDCKFGCGCWMGPSRSDGPMGIDPLGECPNNPLDGKPLRPGKTDYEDCVTQRIQKLESRAYTAEQELKKVSPSKKKLAVDLQTVTQGFNALKRKHERILQNLSD